MTCLISLNFSDIPCVTGKCITCHYNTTGHRCDKCLPGFEGDPLKNISCTWIGRVFLHIN